MEYESESVSCGICGNNYGKLLTLSGQERMLLAKLFKCVSLNKVSSCACVPCLEKLYLIKNFLKKIIINQVRLEATHEKKMQEDPNKSEESQDEEPHVDTYKCRCSDCQKKFGSLPLLVEVIEQNEEKTEKRAEEPQPSTSRELSPKASSKKSMKCAHCDKRFTHKGDLNKHLRKHTGEQPFACPVCDRKFAHTSNLARHMRLHSGDRPFSCEICKKNFSRKDKLDLHRRSKCAKKSDTTS